MHSVPASAESCPDCSGGECPGDIEVILGYTEWVSTTGYGYCKSPTKLETVGHQIVCTKDWDGSQLMTCAGLAGVCAVACAEPPWLACVGCLIVMGAECFDGSCVFVEDCVPSDDEDDAFLIKYHVVDYEADWGPFSKCGE